MLKRQKLTCATPLMAALSLIAGCAAPENPKEERVATPNGGEVIRYHDLKKNEDARMREELERVKRNNR